MLRSRFALIFLLFSAVAHAEPHEPTPEERQRTRQEATERFYWQGVTALRAGNTAMAQEYFERVLDLSPNHVRAQAKLAMIKKRQVKPVAAPTPTPTPSPTPTPEPRRTIKKIAPVLTPEERKAKAADLYLQALKAAQARRFTEAARFCDESLRLDPDNLQAQRMRDRLK